MYIYITIHTHLHIYVYIYIHIHIFIQIYIYIYLSIYLSIYMYLYVYIYLRANPFVRWFCGVVLVVCLCVWLFSLFFHSQSGCGYWPQLNPNKTPALWANGSQDGSTRWVRIKPRGAHNSLWLLFVFIYSQSGWTQQSVVLFIRVRITPYPTRNRPG